MFNFDDNGDNDKSLLKPDQIKMSFKESIKEKK